ncbi:MAG: fibronectin type III domain-containing protein [Balneolaceae bacterium]|nr:fibronectin type III domain-containing protein [Balneolaceae bacterium]
MLKKYLQPGTVLFIVLFMLPLDLTAQSSTNNPEMIILTRDDGSAYILHNTAIPLSHGFHLYRKVEDEEWERLTDTPFFPVQNGYQLERNLGPLFTFIAEELDRNDPQGIFLSLRAQTGPNMIANAAIPELARELGRSYIDEDVPVGSQVSYRFEIINDLERPAGQIIEGSALINPEKPIAPIAVQAEHEGRRITLEWQYPTPEDQPETINTIRFRTFYRDVESGAVEDVTNAILARTLGDRDFRKNFNVPRLNREYEFWVEAVDISGQPSDQSEKIRLHVTDNIAPAIISGVQSSLTEDYESDISWPVSPEIDLAGYHVYVALGEEEEYTRLTDELLPPLQTFFRHTDPIPGGQYRYAVTAVDENGNEGELSNPTHLYIWDSTTPDPVSGLYAEFNTDQKYVSLNWNEPADAEQLRTFQVLRRQIHPAAGGLYDQVNQTALLDETIVDTGYGEDGFREGVFLEYGVVAVGRNGNRSDTTWTEIQIPVLTPPDPPTSVQTRMRNGESVQVTWNASLSGDVTNYRLYRQETGSEETVLQNESGRGNRFFRDSSIELNREYVFSITAVDSVGNESVPTLAEPIATHRLYPPERTRNVQALYTEEGVILQWQVLDDSQVKGYRIYRSGIATGIFEPIGETGAGELRFIHPESEAGQWFKVFPYDHTGREARTAVAVQAVRR